MVIDKESDADAGKHGAVHKSGGKEWQIESSDSHSVFFVYLRIDLLAIPQADALAATLGHQRQHIGVVVQKLQAGR